MKNAPKKSGNKKSIDNNASKPLDQEEVIKALHVKSSIRAGILGLKGGCPTCGLGRP